MTSIFYSGDVCNCPSCGSADIDHEREDLEYVNWWCCDCEWEGYTSVSSIDITLDPVVTTSEGKSASEPPRYTDPGPTLPGFG